LTDVTSLLNQVSGSYVKRTKSLKGEEVAIPSESGQWFLPRGRRKGPETGRRRNPF